MEKITTSFISENQEVLLEPKIPSSELLAFGALGNVLIHKQKSLDKFWSKVKKSGDTVKLEEFCHILIVVFPLLNHKPAILTAHSNATAQFEDYETATLGRGDLKEMLWSCFNLNKVYFVFSESDANQDKVLDVNEFKRCCVLLGKGFSAGKAQSEYESIKGDKDELGYVDFMMWAGTQEL